MKAKKYLISSFVLLGIMSFGLLLILPVQATPKVITRPVAKTLTEIVNDISTDTPVVASTVTPKTAPKVISKVIAKTSAVTPKAAVAKAKTVTKTATKTTSVTWAASGRTQLYKIPNTTVRAAYKSKVEKYAIRNNIKIITSAVVQGMHE
jgi:hypothetical protein